jgi:phosphonatase-like hydrolase
MAGTTVADDGSVMTAFTAAIAEYGLIPEAKGYDEAMAVVHATMGQSKIEVFRQILGEEERAQRANAVFEATYADAVRDGQVTPLPGAIETITALRAAGIRVCLATGFAPATRDALLDALGWWPLIDLALSPAEAGRGRPWPDLPLTALLRLGGGAVTELVVAGDTASDVEAGQRAGAGLVAGVLTGAADRATLERAGAPHILESIAGLLPLLGIGPAVPRETRDTAAAAPSGTEPATVAEPATVTDPKSVTGADTSTAAPGEPATAG